MSSAFHEHAVLIFPGQAPSEATQIDLARRFGDIELLRPDPRTLAVSITNRNQDGTLATAEEFRFKTLRGNEGWHTDSSYMPLAAKASVLCAEVVPASELAPTAFDERAGAFEPSASNR